MTSQWDAQMEAFGAFIRSQRRLANLTLRQLAELTSLSNPYLSELERGMHQPTVRVLKQLSGALNVSAEMLLAEAGLLQREAERGGEDRVPSDTVERAIRTDDQLDDAQKAALLAVYQSMAKGAGAGGSSAQDSARGGSSAQDSARGGSSAQDSGRRGTSSTTPGEPD
jgi:transcriptional regulator with XRE-family HTH domain